MVRTTNTFQGTNRRDRSADTRQASSDPGPQLPLLQRSRRWSRSFIANVWRRLSQRRYANNTRRDGILGTGGSYFQW